LDSVTQKDKVDLVAFATSQFLDYNKQTSDPTVSNAWQNPPCDSFGCALIQWARQAHAVASQIRRSSGHGTSVHLFTPCLHPNIGQPLSSGDAAVRVLIHQHHHAGLKKAIGALHEHALRTGCCAEWRSKAVHMMLRWEIFAMDEAKIVVYLDLDVEVMPRWTSLLLLSQKPAASRDTDEHVKSIGRDWMNLVICASRSRFSLISYPDHSSPVHGALLVARPNLSLFREGLALVRRTVASGHGFNSSLGWDRLGLPHDVVPATDHIWRRRRGHTHLVDQDNWGFVNGETDQGFIFHMLRVRHELGADLRLTECAEQPTPKAAGARRRPAPSSPETMWFHYGATGGDKPDAALRRWHWLMSKRMCAHVHSANYLAGDPEVLLRSLLWVRRTSAELTHLRSQIGPADTVAREQLGLCEASIVAGLRCVSAYAAAHPNTTLHLGGQRMPPRVRGRHTSFADVVDAFISDSETESEPRVESPARKAWATRMIAHLGGLHGYLGRAIPLLASTKKLGGPYTDVPRTPGVLNQKG